MVSLLSIPKKTGGNTDSYVSLNQEQRGKKSLYKVPLGDMSGSKTTQSNRTGL